MKILYALYILPKLCNSVFGKFTIATQPFHFSMGFAVSPVFLQLRKGERQSGYSCVCFAKCSQFTDSLLLHIRVTLGAVRCLQTHDLCGTVIPQGTFSCPSGNSPCAAPSVEQPTCVAEMYLTLRIGWERHGRKNPLPFLYSLSSLIAAVPS